MTKVDVQQMVEDYSGIFVGSLMMTTISLLITLSF